MLQHGQLHKKTPNHAHQTILFTWVAPATEGAVAGSLEGAVAMAMAALGCVGERHEAQSCEGGKPQKT